MDKSRLLANLSIVQAVSSLLHLSFVFNLKYVEEAQTVADIWQRMFAKYGDASGTLTHSKKEVAENKINKYLMVLGQLLAV